MKENEMTEPVKVNVARGKYKLVETKNIVVKERCRKTFEGITALAESIQKFGLDNPVTVRSVGEGKWELIAGERRFRAMVFLGAKEVPVVEREDLDEVQSKELELEENLQRSDLTWAERIEGERQLHELMQRAKVDEGGWTLTDTAKKLKSTTTTVGRNVRFAQKLQERPELREMVEHLPLHAAIKRVEKIEEAEKASREVVGVEGTLVHGDSKEELKKLEDASVQLVLTDPPYGITQLEKNRGSGNNVQVEVLQDTDNLTIDAVKDMASWLMKEIKRVLVEGGHFYIFTCFEAWETMRSAAKAAGLEVQEYGIVWWKERTTAPGRGYLWSPCHEIVLFGWKPPRKRMLEKNMAALVRCKPVRGGIHPFEKPTELLKVFVRQSTIAGELVVDPFAGSGSTLVAALELGRRAWGVEKDPGGTVFPLSAKRVEKALKEAESKVKGK